MSHLTMSSKLRSVARRALMAILLALPGVGPAVQADAATPAEALISDTIQKGLHILDDRGLSAAQRDEQFETLLRGATDMRRISDFTLGEFGPKASPADRDAFAAAFGTYAVAVYRSYLARYSGQTLIVTGSRQNAPGDDIVSTTLADASESGGRPLQIDFRVRSDTAKSTIVDLRVEGVWLALEERDQFTAFLGRNGGSIPALIAHLEGLRAGLAAAH